MIRILIGLVLGLFLGMYVAVSFPHMAKTVISHFR